MIGTIAKFVPLVVFVGAVAVSMKAGLLTADFWGRVGDNVAGAKPLGSVLAQVKSTMLVTLWVFIGIEGAVMQLMMLLVYFSNNAWNVMLSITGVMFMPAYIGATGFLWKLVAQGQYPASAKIGKKTALLSSVLGTVYGFWLVYAAGLEYMIAGTVFFALGNLVFIWARREQATGEAIFTKIELIVALALVVLGATALWMLSFGHLTRVYAP